MLDIVASYHCTQLQGKLMNQTDENGKKTLSFGSDFGTFGPNSGRQKNFFFFFSKIWLRQSLDIMACYHPVQFQKKLMDGRTDRQTDKSDFTGRCPTNVERPKTEELKNICFVKTILFCKNNAE